MSEALSFSECDGFTWAVRPGTGDRVGPGPHEHDIWRLARSFAGPGTAFIDVGAHVGHYSVRLSEAFTKVIAIEPNPAALHTLRLNLRLNDIGNVDVYPVASYESRARLRLWDPFDMIAGQCTRTLGANERAAMPIGCRASVPYLAGEGPGALRGEVEAVPIDLISYRSRERVRFVKIDIEGHEAKALAGASNTIRDHQPAILIEMHDSMYGDLIRGEVIEQLARHGYAWCDFSLYQRSKIVESDMCPYIYAEPVHTGRTQDFLDFAEQANDGAASRWLTTL
jgi:FkbM family methyltransferase